MKTMMNPKKLFCATGLLVLSAGVAGAATAQVETDLNVRAGQGTGHPVIAVMPAGQTVEVSGCGDGWCYVHDYGGYASAAYLGTYGTAYVVPAAPPAVYVAPRVYRDDYYWYDGRRILRPSVRELRRELRQDRRQDRREVRREIRQDRREDRREARQEIRQDRRADMRQERREERRDARQERRENRR
jgi:uncharacterized protein YraI